MTTHRIDFTHAGNTYDALKVRHIAFEQLRRLVEQEECSAEEIITTCLVMTYLVLDNLAHPKAADVTVNRCEENAHRVLDTIEFVVPQKGPPS